jgi:hypothetical protein
MADTTLLSVLPGPRRIVTSHDSEGKAVVSIDETIPSSVSILFSLFHNMHKIHFYRFRRWMAWMAFEWEHFGLLLMVCRRMTTTARE